MQDIHTDLETEKVHEMMIHRLVMMMMMMMMMVMVMMVPVLYCDHIRTLGCMYRVICMHYVHATAKPSIYEHASIQRTNECFVTMQHRAD
jgi:hypothetical protein